MTCGVNIDLVTFAAVETILLKFRVPSLCLLGVKNTFLLMCVNHQAAILDLVWASEMTRRCQPPLMRWAR